MKYYLNKIMLVASIAIVSTIHAQTSTAKQAVIKGKLVEFGNMVEVEEFSELQYLLPKSVNQVIEPTPDSTFILEIPLEAPKYIRIGRNKMYISPGDNLDVVLFLSNSSLSSFMGKGSEVNNYLKTIPFPKGGSFLESGTYILETPAATLNHILQEATKRNKMIANLKNVPSSIKEAEYARVKADMLISFRSVPTYGFMKMRSKSEATAKAYVAEFEKMAAPYKDSLLKDFIHPEYLKIEAYRDYIHYVDLAGAKKPADTISIRDWENAVALASEKIKPENNKTVLKTFEPTIAAIKTPRYKSALQLLMKEKLKFGNGDTAIDFVVRNNDGSSVKLSSLKGKLIYIDIWATWCGPCMAEMPALDEMKNNYSNRNDLAIVSLSVDNNDAIWLKNLEKRQPDGIQWRIDRAMLGDYDVVTVPRYILINKNFTIAELNAPRPSDTNIKSLLTKYLD